MSIQSENIPDILVVTGGVACGKSTFTAGWLRKAPDTRLFCADTAVHELYGTPEVSAKVAGFAGKDVLAEDGTVDRPALRAKVFEDAALRAELEKLIHPLVRQAFEQAITEARHQGVRWLLAEVPLYFESGGKFISSTENEPGRISTVVVACSEATQIERLLRRNGFDKARSESILRSQMPVSEKILRADFVIWNEGAEQVIHRQTELLSRLLDVLCK